MSWDDRAWDARPPDGKGTGAQTGAYGRTASASGPGGVAERLNATVLKTVRPVIPVSRVRIPPPPLAARRDPTMGPDDRNRLAQVKWFEKHPDDLDLRADQDRGPLDDSGGSEGQVQESPIRSTFLQSGPNPRLALSSVSEA